MGYVCDNVLIVDDILDKLVCNMENHSVRQEFDSAVSLEDWYDRTFTVRELLYKVMKRCDIRIYRGTLYFFMGEIWEPISDDLFYRSIELYFMRMHVRNRDMTTKMMKSFCSKAKEAVRLYNPLQPKFSVEAYMNGVVDFSDGALRPFSPAYHVIYKHDFKYDPSADCPLWKKFLRDVLPERESRLCLQMYFGLGTYDRGRMDAKIENCLTLFGSGSNGKGVVMNTMIGVFGRSNVSNVSAKDMFRAGDEGLRAMAKIEGSRFNFCDEITPGDLRGSEDRFKSIISGEAQSGRKLRGDIYTIYNVPWFVLNANTLPKGNDGSYGFFRRFLYVVFEGIIPDEMQNKSLEKELRKEYPGILNWVIRGGRYLKQRGFKFPKSENAEKQRLLVMGESNITFSWAFSRGIRCTPLAENELSEWIRVSDMYEDMRRYADANGFDPVDITTFGRKLRDFGFNKYCKKRDGKGWLYRVYGCGMKGLSAPVPVVQDMDFRFSEEIDKGVNYDPDDL